MLAASQHKPNLWLWLDWKNATREDMPIAISALRDLDARYAIRGRAMVETGSEAVFAEARSVSAAGFTHGYYLPTERIHDALLKRDPDRLAALAREVEHAIDVGGSSAITFDWHLHQFVGEWLSDVVARKHLARYGWDMGIDPSQSERSLELIRERFDEMNLAGLLITFPSVFRT